MIILVRALYLDRTHPPEQSSFTDVPFTDYSFNYVEAAAKAGLVKGNGEGTFGIGSNLSREDMAVLFVRALGIDTTVVKKDTTGGAPGAETKPASGDAGNPPAVMGEYDTLLNRFRDKLSGASLPYNDSQNISEYAKDSVAIATSLGLLSGGANNQFDPHVLAERQEVVWWPPTFSRSNKHLEVRFHRLPSLIEIP